MTNPERVSDLLDAAYGGSPLPAVTLEEMAAALAVVRLDADISSAQTIACMREFVALARQILDQHPSTEGNG